MDYAGSRVLIEYNGKEYKGLVLESGDKNVFLLKLDNGYNIGFDKNKVEIKEILEKKKDDDDYVEKEERTDGKKVVVLATGGTIASKVDYKTGGVVAKYSSSDLLKAVPELKNIANIEAEQVFNEMSENFTYAQWKKISEEVFKKVKSKNVEGVVVSHGTDTMHYSSAALSFFLRNLNKPVAFVGSQRSSDRPSSDAFMNMICATRYALSDSSEVAIVMHGSVSDDYCVAIRGTRARKMHTSRRDAFRPINDNFIMKIDTNGIREKYYYRKRGNKRVELNNKFNENVALVKFFPGMKKSFLEYVLNENDGIVIEGTGLGHVNVSKTRYGLLETIKKGIKEDKFIGMTSQTIYGRVHPFVYSNLRYLSKAGVVYLEDMIPETAYIKLGWAMGQTKDKYMVKEIMLTNYAGEIKKRSLSNEFLL